ncbi:hypothetical protein DEO72_LG10g3388 [Vigna unguiculata]|uniref:Uncharacterized protein n=1 Tax=Vigna unguiculata TaxID=3917 RepID=A0A4D6NJT1_VIGUN|nr:hypothetical protein DEO72_LG10g3388 [Vigna unguiculata]
MGRGFQVFTVVARINQDEPQNSRLSLEKCERISTERQPSGLERNFMLRLSIGSEAKH